MSQPFGYDVPTLSGILLNAQRNNERDGITGALICRHDIYLQLLEGPAAAVKATLDRIRRDDRHVEIRTLVSEKVTERIFAEWEMLHDPAKSLIWTEEDIANGAIERASAAEISAMFTSLAATVAQEA